MFILTLLRIISILLSIVGITFLLPIVVAIYCDETAMLLPFIILLVVSIIAMLVINIPTRKIKFNLSTKKTFITVALSWLFASLFGALPFYYSGYFNSFADAFFESVSGITTTGSTILSEIEILPRSINLWRCLTHWLGGMGIVTLTVALMPLLGVGGFQ